MTRKLTQMSIKLVVLVCLVALPAASFADGSVTSDSTAKIGVERETGDAALAKAIRKSILTDPYYGVFDWIDGQVMNGKVVLSGAVRDPLTKSDVEKRLMKVEGITSIESQIEVLPLSTQDDRLRIASLRLIFGDSSLSRYGLGANPSIHVIVNNGRVTLKGVVANKLERQIAETVLRTNLLAFEVKNDLEVESM